METKHTPGPWQVAQYGDPYTGHGHISIVRGEEKIARLTGISPQRDEVNSRLIAAAPELLAACKALAEVVLNHHDEPDNRSLASPEQPGFEAYQQACAAIEAAEMSEA